MRKIKSFFKNWWKQKPLQVVCVCSAVFLHVCMLTFVFLGKNILPIKPKPTPLVIRTITLPKEPLKTQTKISLQKEAIKKKPAAPKPVVAKKITPKPKAPVKKEPLPKAPSANEKLLHEIQQSMAKIEKNQPKITPDQEIVIPRPIEKLQAEIESDENFPQTDQIQYQELLITFLKQNLQLPAWGKVKLSLTLDFQGRVQKIEVLEAENERNQYYLEQAIPELTFPSLSSYYEREKQHTFILNFCTML